MSESEGEQDPQTQMDPEFAQHVSTELESTLEERDARAVVHVGSIRDPTIRYALYAAAATGNDRATALLSRAGTDESVLSAAPIEAFTGGTAGGVGSGARIDSLACTADPTAHGPVAIAFDATGWLVESESAGSHPADALASRLTVDRATTSTDALVLTPPSVPHDAALHLEGTGFDLASSGVLERARAQKVDAEVAAIERAVAAADAGVARARACLGEATRKEPERDGASPVRLVIDDGSPLTAARLERTVASAALEAGATPVRVRVTTSAGMPRQAGTAAEATESTGLQAHHPLVVDVTTRTATGYHAHLTRTLVADIDGGPYRRGHVALAAAFRSVAAKARADTHPVRALEADLEAEIRAFGFGDGDRISATVAGVGLDRWEEPTGASETARGATLAVAAGIETDAGVVRLADVLVTSERGARWLGAVDRSLAVGR